VKAWAYSFGSWGDYDRNQFRQDCQIHALAYPFRTGHLNLKAALPRTMGLRKKLGITEALRHLGLRFAGSHHRGLDDTRTVRRVCTDC
jgi:inhibitor of KinA sporulation pathway (predicted exonuclease)